MCAYKPVLDPPPISACPKCEYDLQGHEKTGACPECGLEYSFGDLAIVIPRPISPAVSWSIHAAVLSFIGIEYVTPSGSPYGPQVVFLVYLAMVGWSRLRFVIGRWAFRPTGIFHYYNGKERIHIHWDDVIDIKLVGGGKKDWRIAVTPKRRMQVILPCGKDSEAAETMLRLARELWAANSDGRSAV